MKAYTKFALLVTSLALGATPALAAGTSSKPASPPAGSKSKHYGKFCQGEAKTHDPGTKGTYFSRCVTNMSQLANGSATNPTKVCKDLPKKHVKGMTTKGTAYSVCVSGGKKLLKQQSSTSVTT